MTRTAAIVFLVPALGLYWLFLRGDMLGRWWRGAGWRRYPAWLARAWTLFGAGSLTLLAAAGRSEPSLRSPDAFGPARDEVVSLVGDIRG
ncbi:hypothetical protein AB5I41_15670 [Sphingomonas sp. MMS24-JH45]